MSKILVWVFLFSCFFLAKSGFGLFFCESNLLGFFWCFVAEIFIFAKFISKFAKFLGFVGFFCIDWFVRSWHPFGWQENCQENAMIILGLY